MDRSISSVARRRMTDMGTPLADFLTRAAVAASAPASAAASSALVPRRWPFRRGSMPRQADDARTLSRHRCCEWAHGTGAGTQLSSRAARPVGAIGPQLRIVAHFAPTGVAVFCHLFIGKITTSRRFPNAETRGHEVKSAGAVDHRHEVAEHFETVITPIRGRRRLDEFANSPCRPSPSAARHRP
jgi:hypothetical protein